MAICALRDSASANVFVRLWLTTCTPKSLDPQAAFLTCIMRFLLCIFSTYFKFLSQIVCPAASCVLSTARFPEAVGGQISHRLLAEYLRRILRLIARRKGST